MAIEWRPSIWGRLFTRSPHWALRLDDEHVELFLSGSRHRQYLDDAYRIQVIPGVVWSRVELDIEGGPCLTINGLPNSHGARVSAEVEGLLFQRRKRERKALFDAILGKMRSWLSQAGSLSESSLQDRRWITHEQQMSMLELRPVLGVDAKELEKLFLDKEIHDDVRSSAHLSALKALHDWDLDWPLVWAGTNETMTVRELTLAKDFLSRVESKPLTDEQARAVICFDNRVQVVASAGSGKTSTMVAKAAYAIERGFVEPSRVVMLAFNKDAAKELEERAERSFKRLGMNDTVVEARTFHALGLSIIAQTTGRKPDVPAWAVDSAAGLKKLTELVDDLKDRSPQFRAQWDMFRLVFGRDLPPPRR